MPGLKREYTDCEQGIPRQVNWVLKCHDSFRFEGSKHFQLGVNPRLGFNCPMNTPRESLNRLDAALSALEARFVSATQTGDTPARDEPADTVDADQAIAIETARIEARAMARDRERLTDVLDSALSERDALEGLLDEVRGALDEAIAEVRETLSLLPVSTRAAGPSSRKPGG
jgi:hypothetical protein